MARTYSMAPRTRQATGSKRKTSTTDEDLSTADPDYLALSRQQRRQVDNAFDHVVAETQRNKRRKTDGVRASPGATGGGGFIMDDSGPAGGFMSGGGGFMQDDDMAMMGGGFVTENASEPIAQPTAHLYEKARPDDGILFDQLPATFESLGLEWDQDVKEAFEGVCTAKTTDGEVYAQKADFRAVCAAMMVPEPDDDQAGMDVSSDDEEDEADGGLYQDDAEDAEMQGQKDSDDESDQSDDDGDKSFGTPTSKEKRSAKGKKSKENHQDLRMDPAAVQIKLSKEQREWVTMMWNTLFEGSESIIKQHGPRVLGKDQVKRWSEIVDQAWSDAEIVEMIEVFSTIPGKRALSYDDFTTVLVRSGLIQI